MSARATTSAAAAFLLATFASSSAAAPPPVDQQSKCEIDANKYAAEYERKHSRPDIFDFNAPIFRTKAFVPPEPPRSYYDQKSGITFYVESDGRHLAAIDRNGKLLWVRNPFVDGNLCPYRSPHPYIASISALTDGFVKPKPKSEINRALIKELQSAKSHGVKFRSVDFSVLNDRTRFISLKFNSSQFGIVNIVNGDFYEEGQN